MMHMIRYIGLAGFLMLAGCDAHQPEQAWVRPQVQVTFIEPAQLVNLTDAGKTATLWTVRLQVTNQISGTDYSPPNQTVDDATASQAVFDVSLPSDSLYTFAVTYVRGGNTVAEGAALIQVEPETETITIPAVIRDGLTPTVAFVPSTVQVPADPTRPVTLTLRYYGNAVPITSLACNFEVEGLPPSALTVQGPDVVLPEDQQVGTAWGWTTPVTEVRTLATLTVPRTQAGRFCIDVTPGQARTATAEGDVRTVAVVGACIDVLP